MRTPSIRVEKLTHGRFEGFGEIIEAPKVAGRSHFDKPALCIAQGATFSFWCSRIEKLTRLPMIARQMERHRFSSQTFVPLGGATKWLVIVAPVDARDLPDMAGARAFMPEVGQGISYAPNVWHHPMAVLDTAGEFAVCQWKFSDERDEEFVEIPPTQVRLR